MKMTVILRIDVYHGSDSTSTHLLSLTVTVFLHFVVRKSGFTALEHLERLTFGKLCPYFCRRLMMSSHNVIFTAEPKVLSVDRNSYTATASKSLVSADKVTATMNAG